MSNEDVATKNYVDKNAIITVGGVVSGDVKLNVGSAMVRCLVCSDLTMGKKFTLQLEQTQMCYHISYQIYN